MMDRRLEEKWETLLDLGIDEQVLQVVTDINGYNEEALEDILYATIGYRHFEQLDGWEEW